MGESTFLDKVRDFIGGVAWRVYLWSIRMNDEQYDKSVHDGCMPYNGTLHCEHGYNGICKICDAIKTPPPYVTYKA